MPRSLVRLRAVFFSIVFNLVVPVSMQRCPVLYQSVFRSVCLCTCSSDSRYAPAVVVAATRRNPSTSTYTVQRTVDSGAAHCSISPGHWFRFWFDWFVFACHRSPSPSHHFSLFFAFQSHHPLSIHLHIASHSYNSLNSLSTLIWQSPFVSSHISPTPPRFAPRFRCFVSSFVSRPALRDTS